jgi:hypothetical protein
MEKMKLRKKCLSPVGGCAFWREYIEFFLRVSCSRWVAEIGGAIAIRWIREGQTSLAKIAGNPGYCNRANFSRSLRGRGLRLSFCDCYHAPESLNLAIHLAVLDTDC